MSEVCKSLINDYITGALSLSDFEEGLSSIFGTSPGSHTNAQTYLQKLYTSDQLDSTGFTEISHVISKVNIAFGGMAATPKRAANAEAALKGQPWSQAAFVRTAHR